MDIHKMTNDKLQEVNGIYARLIYLSRIKDLLSFQWYERELLRDRLAELKVDRPNGV